MLLLTYFHQLFALLNGLSGASLATVCEMCSLTIRKEVDELTMNAELRRSDGSKEEPPLGLPNGVIAVLTRNSANPPTSRNDRLKMLLAWILVCGFFKDTVSHSWTNNLPFQALTSVHSDHDTQDDLHRTSPQDKFRVERSTAHYLPTDFRKRPK